MAFDVRNLEFFNTHRLQNALWSCFYTKHQELSKQSIHTAYIYMFSGLLGINVSETCYHHDAC